MWSTINTWGLPVTLAELQEACETCVLLMRASPEACGNSWAGGSRTVPLTWWQVDVIRPLPISEGYKYAITYVEMSTGLLAAYPAQHPDQKVVIIVLERICIA